MDNKRIFYDQEGNECSLYKLVRKEPGWAESRILEGFKDREKAEKAIELAVEYGGIDGGHHKAWVIDQIVRILAGHNYDKVVADACDGVDGPETYAWGTGIAP